MGNNNKRIKTKDFSKHPFYGPQHDYRTGEADIGLRLNFAPFESGYCFLTVIGTPSIMWGPKHGGSKGFEDNDNRGELLGSFIHILEREFSGLSGIEDGQLSGTDISNNVINAPIISKNDKNPYTNISMQFTEKSGLPIMKFLDMYSKFIYDPYTQAKTYGGRNRTDSGAKEASGIGEEYAPIEQKLQNETFTLLYTITDKTCLLVEKAYILYHAYPLNTPWSAISDNTKFDVDKKDITLNWSCEVLDGPLANRLGAAYVRNLFERVLKKSDIISNNADGIEERDWHFMADNKSDSDSNADSFDTYNFYQMAQNPDDKDTKGFRKFKKSYAYMSGLPTFKAIIDRMEKVYNDKATVDPWGIDTDKTAM